MPRLTIRRMMLLVAAAALLCVVVLWGVRADHHRNRAAYFAKRESGHRQMAANQAEMIAKRSELIALTEGMLEREPGREDLRRDLDWQRSELAANEAEAAFYNETIAYFAAMKVKHSRAIRFPLAGVEPDPPEPE